MKMHQSFPVEWVAPGQAAGLLQQSMEARRNKKKYDIFLPRTRLHADGPIGRRSPPSRTVRDFGTTILCAQVHMRRRLDVQWWKTPLDLSMSMDDDA